MFNLDDYISDLQETSVDMLDDYVAYDCKDKDKRAIKNFITNEIIKHLDKAGIKIEKKLKEFYLSQQKDKNDL